MPPVKPVGNGVLRVIVRPVYRLVVKTPGRVTAFSRELRRRRVIGTVIAYAIAAAGVMQVADVVAPRMNLPDSTVTIVIFIALLGLPVAAVLAWFYHVEEAESTAVEAVRAAPDYDRAHATLAWVYLLTKRAAEGIAELEKAVGLTPDNTGWWSQLAQAYALHGNPQKARDILEKLTEKSAHSYVSPYHFAYVYTGLGEYDTAMDYLEIAYRERAGAIYGIKGSFLFTDLKSHPRFIALLEKMNLA